MYRERDRITQNYKYCVNKTYIYEEIPTHKK